MKFLGHTDPYPVTMLEPAAPAQTEVERLQQEVADLRVQLDSVTKERDTLLKKARAGALPAGLDGSTENGWMWLSGEQCKTRGSLVVYNNGPALSESDGEFGRARLTIDQCQAMAAAGWVVVGCGEKFHVLADRLCRKPKTHEMLRAAQLAGIRLQVQSRHGGWANWCAPVSREIRATRYRISPEYENGPTAEHWPAVAAQPE